MTERASVSCYYMPLTFPCGPESACCGPVGQTEAEVGSYARQLREALPGVAVDLVDASRPLQFPRDRAILRLLRAFGCDACPIFAVNGEVVSMGPPAVEELVHLIGAKLADDA